MVAGPVLRTLSSRRAGIVFLDPPYDLESEYAGALAALSEAAPALTIMQHSVRFALPDEHGALLRARLLKQGDNALSFYVTKA